MTARKRKHGIAVSAIRLLYIICHACGVGTRCTTDYNPCNIKKSHRPNEEKKVSETVGCVRGSMIEHVKTNAEVDETAFTGRHGYI